ncbi:MAG: phage terminase large subunit family protein, partial [Planctomycetota bacterium]
MRRISRRFAAAARGRRLRSRLEFAQHCIVLPNEGPYKNQNWRPHFQPYTAAVLNLMDQLAYRKYRFTGCVQSGKSFVGVICVLWHLFERGENVGYAVPDLDQSARDKWHQEFLPVILASPELRRHLPDSGEGSQGGTPSLIKFKNGATLRFISGTGKDHHRSNFTVDVVFKTEVDRYDTAGDVSRETSPPEQIENRIEAAGDNGFSYEECTVTEKSGRIWTELLESTNHRLCVECVHCGDVVCPGREDLHGVEAAEDVIHAGEHGCFRCPSCHEAWTEEQRGVMVQNLIPVGEGQTARIGGDGCALVEGELKPTDRLGFSWNEFHNAFHTTSKIARDEYNALYSKHPTELELKRRQHAWTLPSEPDEFNVTQLTIRDIIGRAYPAGCDANDWRRTIPLGYAPPRTRFITRGVDVGKRQLHFVTRAWFYEPGADGDQNLNSRPIDLGEVPVRTDEIGIRKALPEA